jgi:hypothetical protein
VSRKSRLAIFLLLIVTFSSGCCSINPQPCCSSYDRLPLSGFTLAQDKIEDLEKMNTSLLNERKQEIRLAVCNSLMSKIVHQAISDYATAACSGSGLSQKDKDECLAADCQGRLKAELCTHITPTVQNKLTACSEFPFNGANCIYSE